MLQMMIRWQVDKAFSPRRDWGLAAVIDARRRAPSGARTDQPAGPASTIDVPMDLKS